MASQRLQVNEYSMYSYRQKTNQGDKCSQPTLGKVICARKSLKTPRGSFSQAQRTCVSNMLWNWLRRWSSVLEESTIINTLLSNHLSLMLKQKLLVQSTYKISTSKQLGKAWMYFCQKWNSKCPTLWKKFVPFKGQKHPLQKLPSAKIALCKKWPLQKFALCPLQGGQWKWRKET